MDTILIFKNWKPKNDWTKSEMESFVNLFSLNNKDIIKLLYDVRNITTNAHNMDIDISDPH